jgi:Helix-turn-helix domain
VAPLWPLCGLPKPAMLSVMTIKDAMQALGLSRTRIRQLVADGRLQAYLEHGHWTIEPEALELVRLRPVGRPVRYRSWIWSS